MFVCAQGLRIISCREVVEVDIIWGVPRLVVAQTLVFGVIRCRLF